MTTIFDVPNLIFTDVATRWELSARIVSITTRPCCDDPTCHLTEDDVVIELTRPGCVPLQFSTVWTYIDTPTELSPSQGLRELADCLSGMFAEDPFGEDTHAAVKTFCWGFAPIDGVKPNEPCLEPEHIAAFAMTANAIEVYIDEPEITVSICGGLLGI